MRANYNGAILHTQAAKYTSPTLIVVRFDYPNIFDFVKISTIKGLEEKVRS